MIANISDQFRVADLVYKMFCDYLRHKFNFTTTFKGEYSSIAMRNRDSDVAVSSLQVLQ